MNLKICFDYKRLEGFVEFDPTLISKNRSLVDNTYVLAEILCKNYPIKPFVINKLFTNLMIGKKIIKIERTDNGLYLLKYLKDRGFIYYEIYNKWNLCLIMLNDKLAKLFTGDIIDYEYTEYRNACSQCMNKKTCINFGFNTHECKQRILYRSENFMTFDHSLCPSWPYCLENQEGCHFLFGKNVTQ